MKIKIIGIGIALALAFTSANASPPKDASEVKAHLEFLGYEISSSSQRMKATHATELNFFMKSFRGGILVTAFFGGNDLSKRNKAAFLEVLNSLNAKSAASRYYVDGDGDMAIEAYYPGSYDKKSFAAFLDAFQLERANIAELGDEITMFLE